MNQNISTIAQMVREQDPDRFLITMMMPPEFHEDILALLALNIEIAKTREVVSETMLGQIRLKWWQEAIQAIYDTGIALEHDVLRALARAITRRGLSYAYFETMIYAREFDLEDVLPGNLEGLANYCDFTLSPLLKLIMQVMGDDPESGSEPVQAVALNYAVTGLLRAVPFHGGQQRCYMPEDLMNRFAQNKFALYEGKIAPEFPAIVQEVSSLFVKGLKPENEFLKASNHLAQIYWRQLKANRYDVFAPKMQIQPAFKALRLVFAQKFLK